MICLTREQLSMFAYNNAKPKKRGWQWYFAYFNHIQPIIISSSFMFIGRKEAEKEVRDLEFVYCAVVKNASFFGRKKETETCEGKKKNQRVDDDWESLIDAWYFATSCQSNKGNKCSIILFLSTAHTHHTSTSTSKGDVKIIHPSSAISILPLYHYVLFVVWNFW